MHLRDILPCQDFFVINVEDYKKPKRQNHISFIGLLVFLWFGVYLILIYSSPSLLKYIFFLI